MENYLYPFLIGFVYSFISLETIEIFEKAIDERALILVLNFPLTSG